MVPIRDYHTHWLLHALYVLSEASLHHRHCHRHRYSISTGAYPFSPGLAPPPALLRPHHQPITTPTTPATTTDRNRAPAPSSSAALVAPCGQSLPFQIPYVCSEPVWIMFHTSRGTIERKEESVLFPYLADDRRDIRWL